MSKKPQVPSDSELECSWCKAETEDDKPDAFGHVYCSRFCRKGFNLAALAYVRRRLHTEELSLDQLKSEFLGG